MLTSVQLSWFVGLSWAIVNDWRETGSIYWWLVITHTFPRLWWAPGGILFSSSYTITILYCTVLYWQRWIRSRDRSVKKKMCSIVPLSTLSVITPLQWRSDSLYIPPIVCHTCGSDTTLLFTSHIILLTCPYLILLINTNIYNTQLIQIHPNTTVII